MHPWLRSACAALALVLGAPAASAQTPAQKAEQLNDEGKVLFGDKRYTEASRRFRQAIVLSPDGRFYFNLCFTFYFMERYAEALEQCRLVTPTGAEPRLIEKTDQLIAELEKRVPPEPRPGPGPGPDPGAGHTDPPVGPDPGHDPHGDPGGHGGPVGPADPGLAAPGGPGAPPAHGGAGDFGEPGPPDPFAAASDPHAYRWSVGGEIGPVSNLSIGRQNGNQNFGGSGVNLRLFANFLMGESSRFGFQTYLGLTNFEAGDANFIGNDLQILDLGGAVFLHRRLSGRLYWTPLVGAHLAFLQVDEFNQDSFVTLGLRGEVSLAYLLGERGQHALTFTPGLNVYFPANTASSDFSPTVFGLDEPGSALSLSVGYTARFSTPFGAGPLISLE
jgi:hypothetical protein